MNICVFSSSSNAISEIYFEEAEKLGKLIGEGRHTLINGGANVGLMETVTVSAGISGGQTIGIIPERIYKKDLASVNSNKIIVTKNMHERKAKMREISDAFIALPGGFGTLEEILEVLTLKQLSYHSKPIVFINTNNFFNFLLKYFEFIYHESFVKEIYRNLYFIADNEYIKNYTAAELDPKWFIVPGKEN